jgi:hypothetical protein
MMITPGAVPRQPCEASGNQKAEEWAMVRIFQANCTLAGDDFSVKADFDTN